MRSGIRGSLYDASITGVAVLLPEPLNLGERISVELENPVHRLKLCLHGWVTHVQRHGADMYRIGCDILTRLPAREVHLLKQAHTAVAHEIRGQSAST